ncbi:MAG: helix-turn-helix transcriptional regulator [Hyphomicrobiales bacterium]|nr:helix-turn-helix transcriptional regulator [Hyphomicrobiales bacterium]
MLTKRIDQLKSIGNAALLSDSNDDCTPAKSLFLEHSQSHGFHEFTVLDISQKMSGMMRPTIQLASFSDTFVKQVEETGDLGTCTLFERLDISTVPFAWEIGGRTTPLASPTSAELGINNLLSGIDIKCGYCVPVHSALGKRGAVLYFRKERQFAEKHPALVLNTMRTYELYINLFSQYASQPQLGLSTLELKCLQSIAAGKTVSETAKMVSLSDHTVNYCIAAATRKLGATNLTHAFYKAIQSGLPVL